MGCAPSDMGPQELIEFRKVNTSIENVEIPARPESRTLTDKKGFVMVGIGIIILVPLLIYCLVNVDLRLLRHPNDDCANFCGLDNLPIEGISCSGRNYVDKPYLELGRCTDDCAYGRVLRNGQCVKDNPENRHRSEEVNVESYLDGFALEGWKVFVAILVTIILSVLILAALRYLPAVVVWTILIFSVIFVIAIAVGLWYIYGWIVRITDSDPNVKIHPQLYFFILLVSVIWTLFVLILLIVIFVLIKKIRLIIQLYQEAVKVLAAMPFLIFVTISITIVQLIILEIFYTTSFYLSLFVELDQLYLERGVVYTYRPTSAAVFTLLLNIVVTIWVMHCVSGIQYMIISGSVARWFFAKNKEHLDSPILTSTKVTLKYHLGTVAFGSFFIMLFSVVKSILRAFCRNVCCRCCIVIWCSPLEIMVKFISENSYIQTAIHGKPYCKSAKRATNLLLTNAKSVAAINCVGDFILVMVIFFTTVVATGISFAVFQDPNLAATVAATFICLIINIIIISVVFATFQIIVDTLLLCFCEDKALNDGISRPYYMSRGLMEFVENSKKIYG